MGGSKKRKRNEQQQGSNGIVYSESPPDFALLASLYPSFHTFVQSSPPHMRPTIDWTDFNATRELTRVLLHHRHNLTWWIPDGQLCPTVPNRCNYIHWLQHLLSSDIIPGTISRDAKVRGFDIGTGTSCIYPLLGASLHGWSFVGSDVTDVAIEWAEKNVSSNSHISHLIEIRKVKDNGNAPCVEVEESVNGDQTNSCKKTDVEVAPLPLDLHVCENKNYHGPPILVGVVRDDEKFDFCMCNPPFFESLKEAGLNPKTSCGGTSHEMVCPGGERAFIIRIIEDSTQLKQHFRWFTSMVGKKSNLKYLVSKLWGVGVSIVKTTEFVQGRTFRWGLAWSFLPPIQKPSISLSKKINTSFTLEGLQRQHSAINVLETVKFHFSSHGLSCSLNTSSFTVDVAISKDDCDSILRNDLTIVNNSTDCQPKRETSNESSLNISLEKLCFRISVFQQIPGTLLVKGSLQDKNSPLSGAFSVIFQQLEEALRSKFCTKSLVWFQMMEMSMLAPSFPGFAKPSASLKPSLLTLRASSLRHDYPLASKVVVKNLPYSTGETTLRKEFSNFGKIAEVKMVKDMNTKRSKGIAFIQYTCQDDAMLALETMDQKDFYGRTIYVEIARLGWDYFGATPKASGPPTPKKWDSPEQEEVVDCWY